MYSAHAEIHTEADKIRECFQDPANIKQIWLNSSGERLNCLVDIGNGKVGDLVLQWCKRAGWMEITSYVIGDGTLTEAIRVLRAKICTQVYP